MSAWTSRFGVTIVAPGAASICVTSGCDGSVSDGPTTLVLAVAKPWPNATFVSVSDSENAKGSASNAAIFTELVPVIVAPGMIVTCEVSSVSVVAVDSPLAANAEAWRFACNGKQFVSSHGLDGSFLSTERRRRDGRGRGGTGDVAHVKFGIGTGIDAQTVAIGIRTHIQCRCVVL